MSKNHDFKLDLPQIEGINYLIQYREFIPSVVSNFELHLRAQNVPDTSYEFRHFVSVQWDRYQGFCEKWVKSQFAISQTIVCYEELVSDPTKTMLKVIKLFEPKIDPDIDSVHDIVTRISGITHTNTPQTSEGLGVKSTRNVKEFRHYNQNLFDTISRLTLTRKEVIRLFKEVHGTLPLESNILRYQSFTDIESLKSFLTS